MTINIEIEYVKRIERENEELEDENNQLKQELFNAYLKEQHQELLIKELKLALSSYNNFVDVMFPD